MDDPRVGSEIAAHLLTQTLQDCEQGRKSLSVQTILKIKGALDGDRPPLLWQLETISQAWDFLQNRFAVEEEQDFQCIAAFLHGFQQDLISRQCATMRTYKDGKAAQDAIDEE